MLKHALMGFGISLACLLPPIVHLISGPLGPFIGGWFAGSKHQATPSQAIGIGSLMGLFMVLPLVALLAVNNLVLSWVEDDSLLIIIGIVVLGYTAVLGTVGAMVGGYMLGRSSRKVEAGAGG
jgi:nitric oxide reductase large subunit